MLKIVTVVGARPQFIKAATVSRAIRRHNVSPEGVMVQEVILHTGQHFDENMSQVFFDELDIPRPDYNLDLGGGRHGEMTGRMITAIEDALIKESPDWLLVYGDTNSTLAGALAAVKLHIPIAHIEAGLRSFNRRMPEEVNRVLTDHISTLLFCPTSTAVKNLSSEGVEKGVIQVGDVMYDASLFYKDVARQHSDMLERLGLTKGEYILTTLHRQENTDNPERMRGIVDALAELSRNVKVVLPLHPRARKILTDSNLLRSLKTVLVIEPISFLDMVQLEQSAQVIVTDSGGVQKEAFFYGVPCVTMRDETEWVETVESEWNTLVGADSQRITGAALEARRPKESPSHYGDGQAAEHILSHLIQA